MALIGETVASGADASIACDICGSEYVIGVYMSGAGYYVGYACTGCGSPFSRESGYFPTREDAEAALSEGWTVRSTEYKGG